MVARVRIVRDQPTREDWLASVSDRILACRAQQHDWPRIRRQGRLPKGLRATIQRQGVVQLTYTCQSCGTVRVTETAPAGVVEYPRRYRYEYPEGYASPKDSNITRRELFDELWGRVIEEIQLNADRPADLAEPGKGSAATA